MSEQDGFTEKQLALPGTGFVMRETIPGFDWFSKQMKAGAIKSWHSTTLAKYGLWGSIILQPQEKMSEKMASAVAGIKHVMKQHQPDIVFNDFEVFPIDRRRCIVLVTGWNIESYVLDSAILPS
jgi:hypothetical protein